MFYPGMGPMGPMGMNPWGMPMMYDANAAAPQPKKPSPPPALDKWKEWSGTELARWLNAHKLPEGMKYAYDVLIKNINGIMLPKLTVEDLTALNIKLPHAKLIVEYVKTLKDGTAAKGALEFKDDAEEQKEDAAEMLEPFSLPSRLGDEQYDFFLSHRGPDTKAKLVKPLSQLLHAFGVSCFFDRDIEVGLTNEEAVARGLFGSQYGLVFLSPTFLDSKWCVKEMLTLYQRSQFDRAFSGVIPVFCSVKPDLSGITDEQQKMIQTYQKQIKGITHIAGVELQEMDCKSLKKSVVTVLLPVLFKLMKKPCPPVDELKRVASQVFSQ